MRTQRIIAFLEQRPPEPMGVGGGTHSLSTFGFCELLPAISARELRAELAGKTSRARACMQKLAGRNSTANLYRGQIVAGKSSRANRKVDSEKVKSTS